MYVYLWLLIMVTCAWKKKKKRELDKNVIMILVKSTKFVVIYVHTAHLPTAASTNFVVFNWPDSIVIVCVHYNFHS